jgi:hypothetical protein
MMEELPFEDKAEEWRLFLDSCEVSLMVRLLGNGRKPFSPVDHVVLTKEI